MGKGWSIFGGGTSGYLEIAIINFTSQLLFDFLFMCWRKGAVPLVIFYMFLAYFILLNVFSVAFYLIASLRRKVYRS